MHNFKQGDIDRMDAVMFSFDYREDWVEIWILKD
jgi:hypothetical protein